MDITQIVKQALAEDIGQGDVTTKATVGSGQQGKASIKAKQSGIICGLKIAELVFKTVDKTLQVGLKNKDGDRVTNGNLVLTVQGKASSILKAERVALNFLQRLSGIATLTSAYVGKVKHAQIYDTRKTTPLFRELERTAVKTGGGNNHRFNLNDQILIKENHIAMAEGIACALQLAAKKFPDKKREVEIQTSNELKLALEQKAEILLLDNFTPAQVGSALMQIEAVGYKPVVEVSGGITLENIADYDLPGVHRISVGAITHSVPALDISLSLSPKKP